jgi:acyl-CoA thioesterase-1
MAVSTWGVIGGAILLGGIEIPWTKAPTLPAVGAKNIYVIGDSMSSGLGAKDEPWPAILGRENKVSVVNLSSPGIGAAEAVELAAKVVDPDSIVIVEIGGNDLIGGTEAEAFEVSLGDLHSRLRGKTKAIVMMELPLPPGKVEYGKIQRRYVERGVYLVPKRIFVKVLMAGESVDGLHLGRAGAEAMAREVWQIVSPAVER